MAKYKVYGRTFVEVVVEVEADSPEAAMDEAFGELSALSSFIGNGGSDKLIGVYHHKASVRPSDIIEYKEAELV